MHRRAYTGAPLDDGKCEGLWGITLARAGGHAAQQQAGKSDATRSARMTMNRPSRRQHTSWPTAAGTPPLPAEPFRAGTAPPQHQHRMFLMHDHTHTNTATEKHAARRLGARLSQDPLPSATLAIAEQR